MHYKIFNATILATLLPQASFSGGACCKPASIAKPTFTTRIVLAHHPHKKNKRVAFAPTPRLFEVITFMPQNEKSSTNSNLTVAAWSSCIIQREVSFSSSPSVSRPNNQSQQKS